MSTILLNKLKEKLNALPEKSGVYKMLDSSEKIIYVGKAKNLKNRIKSYFNSISERAITRELIKNISDVDIIITHNEKEALVLENNLIKINKPKYNLKLKDAKSYPYLKLIRSKKFPRLIKTREINKEAISTKDSKENYYGPYTDVHQLYKILKIAHEIFPLKKCKQQFFPQGFKPCIYFHINKCLPYCTGQIEPDTVKKMLFELDNFLKGDIEKIKKKLMDKMKKYASELKFESAEEIKKMLKSLESSSHKQNVSYLKELNYDVINWHLEEQIISLVKLVYRNGILIDKENEFFNIHFENFVEKDDKKNEMEDLINTVSYWFISHYSSIKDIPSQIIIPWFKGYREAIVHILQERHQGIQFLTPQKGYKLEALKLAKSNAKYNFLNLIKKREQKKFGKYLKEMLQLPRNPQVIESFDIANTGDKAILAGMICYRDGMPDKNQYRIFKMKTTAIQDDFLSIEEAVFRRYRRLLKEKKSLPDLIQIDGGKGQLNAAKKSLEKLKLMKVPVISLAKKEELIFVPKKSEPLHFPHDHPGLQFLVKVRDETHRWTNKSHKKIRDKENLNKQLEKINGLGPKKISFLYSQFKNIDMIKAASQEKICQLPFLGKSDYKNIQNYFESLENISLEKSN